MEKNKFLNDILKDLRNTSKYLSEAYIFDDHEGTPGAPGEPEMAPMDNPPMEQPQQAQMQQGDSAEEQAMHAQDVIKHEPIIGKIRETAIDGLKKYADNPTSSLYEFFKKVFLESDKVLTDTGGKK